MNSIECANRVEMGRFQMVDTSGGMFPRDATCVKTAAAENNVEMLQTLLTYNAQAIAVPYIWTPSILDINSPRSL